VVRMSLEGEGHLMRRKHLERKGQQDPRTPRENGSGMTHVEQNLDLESLGPQNTDRFRREQIAALDQVALQEVPPTPDGSGDDGTLMQSQSGISQIAERVRRITDPRQRGLMHHRRLRVD